MLTFRFPQAATVTLSEPGAPVVDAVTDLNDRAALAGLRVSRQGGLGTPRWLVPCSADQATSFELTAPDLFAAYAPTFTSRDDEEQGIR